jgi:hypothetical protein
VRLEHFLTQGTKEKFLIQDPFGLREAIQPVVSISETEDKITGLGTCFQVSPWLWLTAHHVVQHSSSSIFPPGEIGAVGFSMGLVFGTVGFVASDVFGPIVQCTGFKPAVAGDTHVGPRPPNILIDVAALRVNVDKLKRQRVVSPLPVAKNGTNIGDEVFAIGYPILGSKFDVESTRSIFEERMYGASGIVTAVYPNGTSSSKPWPTFQIEGNWESGMSGGPVISIQGQVVGIVSSSLAPYDHHPGVGFAVDLPRIPLNQIAPELDLLNPGFIVGYGVFKSGQLSGFYPSEEIAQLAVKESPEVEIRKLSLNPKTESWMTISH